jgi:hypothetical protein
MRNLRILGRVVLLAMPVAAYAVPPDQVASEVAPAAGISASQTGDGSAPATKRRLRFKSSGPVCMCAEGMSERDIEKNRLKHEQDKSVDTISGAGR